MENFISIAFIILFPLIFLFLIMNLIYRTLTKNWSSLVKKYDTGNISRKKQKMIVTFQPKILKTDIFVKWG